MDNVQTAVPTVKQLARARFLRGARRASTQTVGGMIFALLANGPAVVNVAELGRQTGLSRPTVGRAVAFFARFGRITLDEDWQQGHGHPGRPARYALHPSFTACVGNCDSAKRVNPNNSRESKPRTPLKATERTAEDLASFVRFENPQLVPTARQRRRLSAALRLQVAPALADALLAELWRRTRAPLSLWRDAIGAVWTDPPSSSSLDDDDELTWRVRLGLRDLAADGDRGRFLRTITGAPSAATAAEREQRRAAARLAGLERWRQAETNLDGDRLGWFVEIRRELERVAEGLSAGMRTAVEEAGLYAAVQRDEADDATPSAATATNETPRRDLAAERIESNAARQAVAEEMGAATIADGLRARDSGRRSRPRRAERGRSVFGTRAARVLTNTPTRRVAVGPTPIGELVEGFVEALERVGGGRDGGD